MSDEREHAEVCAGGGCYMMSWPKGGQAPALAKAEYPHLYGALTLEDRVALLERAQTDPIVRAVVRRRRAGT